MLILLSQGFTIFLILEQWKDHTQNLFLALRWINSTGLHFHLVVISCRPVLCAFWTGDRASRSPCLVSHFPHFLSCAWPLQGLACFYAPVHTGMLDVSSWIDGLQRCSSFSFNPWRTHSRQVGQSVWITLPPCFRVPIWNTDVDKRLCRSQELVLVWFCHLRPYRNWYLSSLSLSFPHCKSHILKIGLNLIVWVYYHSISHHYSCNLQTLT